MSNVPSERKSAVTSGESATRKKRYTRAATPDGLATLTPTKVAMLRFLAEMRFLSLPQLARLCCPSEREVLSQKSARKHLRALFDAGLVDVLPVSRLALAPLDAPNDETLLYGSAPNVYTSTMEGLQMLYKAGLICREWAKRAPATYGPKNSLFLAHELEVRDVRVWLEECSRFSGGEQRILTWKDGKDAALDLGQNCSPHWVQPDAWFVHQIKPMHHTCSNPVVLVALVEVDRGTERGMMRWQEKIKAYAKLFSCNHLINFTGYQNARVLVLTPDEKRRDALVEMIRDDDQSDFAHKFWLAERKVIRCDDLSRALWRRPIDNVFKGLI